MKHLVLLLAAFIALQCHSQQSAVKDGDIIFQSSGSPQCQAIKLATHSEYSHCGIVFMKDGKPLVYEAIQPVSVTPLDEWIKRGDNDHYIIKRLKDTAPLTSDVLKKMHSAAAKYVGIDYDLYFGWGNDRMYCSELVWKVYQQAAKTKLTPLKPLKSYDLEHPLVKIILKERYGNNLPLEELMVSPGDIFNSPLLETVVVQ